MSYLIRAPNGEIVEIGTGIVQGFTNSDFPEISKDADSLLRHFNGVSAEPLGSVPKVKVLSTSEIILLRKLRPWDMLKYEFREDYRQLIEKLNTFKLGLNRSIIMKNRWRDPYSSHNNIDQVLRVQKMRMTHADPTSFFNSAQSRTNRIMGAKSRYAKMTDAERIHLSVRQRQGRWGDHIVKVKQPRPPFDFSEHMRKIRGDMNPIQKLRYDRKTGYARRRNAVFKKSGESLSMLFDTIIEDTQLFTCTECGATFNAQRGLSVHLTRGKHYKKSFP